MRTIRQWLLGTLILWGTSLVPLQVHAAGASDVADEAQFYFDRGNAFYRQGKFDDALAAYYTSDRLVGNRNVRFNIARCLDKLGLYDEAFRAWSALLDEKASPEERQRIETSIESLRSNLALVNVQSDPPGALIFVGRKDLGSLGETPMRLALRPGDTTILLEKAGHRPVSINARLSKGEQQEVMGKLEPIYGQLDLRRLPGDAQVRRDYVDGPVLRTGPGTVQLRPGRVVLFASAPLHATLRLEVEVKADQTVPVDVPLVRQPAPTGTLVVQANVDSALVRIDGREMGFTPAVIEGVSAGQRKIEVLREGRETFRTTLEIKVGDRSYLDVKLKHADPEISAATKSLIGARQAPGAVSIITADEIAAFGWTTLADALSGLRGAFASNDRAYESVGFQGFSKPGDYTNRVLVLVDGHPFNDVLVGQGFVGRDFDVDLDNVLRIEVVRGPGSVLYGTMALFGVVNVVTRQTDQGVHSEFSSRVGTLGMVGGRATAGVAGKDSSFRVSVAHLGQVGDRNFGWGDADATKAETVAVKADRERATHVDVSAHWRMLKLRVGINDRKKNLPTGAFGVLPIPGNLYHDRRAYAELRADIPMGNFLLSARAAYDQADFGGDYLYESETAGALPELYQDKLRSRWATGELRLTTPVWLRQQFTLGTEVQSQYDLDLGPQSYPEQVKHNADSELILSSYAVDDVRITDRIHLNLGVRADRYAQSFGNTVNPRMALIVRSYEGGNTKLLGGRAFRAPSAYERFYNDIGEADTQKSAVSLQPETIVSAELEHSHTFGEEMSLVASAFVNEVNGLIDLDTDPVDGLLVYRNADNKVRGVGGTGELRWDPGTGTVLTLAYTGQRVRQQGETRQYVNAPEQIATVRSIWGLLPGVARIANELQYDIGRHDRTGQRLDDAVIWNVTLSGEFRKYRLRYFAGLYNILDVVGTRTGFPVGDEVGAVTVPRYGRNARVGLSWRF